MADEKLNDNQVWERLHAAIEALGDASGHTTAGDTAMKTARRTLTYLQIGVLKAAEADQEPFKGPGET